VKRFGIKSAFSESRREMLGDESEILHEGRIPLFLNRTQIYAEKADQDKCRSR
jgi:hypothetical protein